ncbi:MAG: cytochrome c biogenesis protein CcsA, partial [Dokdonella sp.]|uniref:cytochrome c biogenesis protein CcsA n=1 Tax=Dokdonella sp. TaxID=2291710 RepID=UPI003F7EA48F
MPITILAAFAVLAYLVASLLLARPLLGRGEVPAKLPLAIASLAVLAHAGVLLGAHRGTLDLHFFAALSLVAGVVSMLTLIVNLSRPVATLGVIVFPLTALLLAIDVYAAPATAPQPIDWQIKLHVSVALLAFGVLSIAAALAILLALQERALRHRQFGALLHSLPPLTLTEALL